MWLIVIETTPWSDPLNDLNTPDAQFAPPANTSLSLSSSKVSSLSTWLSIGQLANLPNSSTQLSASLSCIIWHHRYFLCAITLRTKQANNSNKPKNFFLLNNNFLWRGVFTFNPLPPHATQLWTAFKNYNFGFCTLRQNEHFTSLWKKKLTFTTVTTSKKPEILLSI